MTLNLSGIGKLQAAQPELEKLRQTTRQIEGVFVKQLLEQMQRGTQMFGEGTASNVYQDLFNQELATSIARTGQFGIGDLLYRQMAPRVIQAAPSHPDLPRPENP